MVDAPWAPVPRAFSRATLGPGHNLARRPASNPSVCPSFRVARTRFHPRVCTAGRTYDRPWVQCLLSFRRGEENERERERASSAISFHLDIFYRRIVGGGGTIRTNKAILGNLLPALFKSIKFIGYLEADGGRGGGRFGEFLKNEITRE